MSLFHEKQKTLRQQFPLYESTTGSNSYRGLQPSAPGLLVLPLPIHLSKPCRCSCARDVRGSLPLRSFVRVRIRYA
jgi:hypothetical protein